MEISNEKPVIIKYTATWCGPCQNIKPKYKQLSLKYKTMRFAEIDIDKFDEISNSQNVKAIPAFLVYVDGRIAHRSSGSDPKKLERVVKYFDIK